MTNEVFWNRLTEIMLQAKDTGMIDAAMLIKEAYEQNLDFLAACRFNTDETTAYQIYMGRPSMRWLVCWSNKDSAMKGTMKYKTDLTEIPVREMINNAFNKDSIQGLIVDPFRDDDCLLIPKFILQMMMPGKKPKPKGFSER